MDGPARGMKASQLVLNLQKLIAEHGDHEVRISPHEYPEGCTYVVFKRDDAFKGDRAFKIG